MQIVTFIQQHWVDILAIIGAFDMIMGVIVKWTPCEWDNNLYSIIHSWISQILGKGK